MNIRRQSGNFQFREDTFSKNVQGIIKIYHEVSLLMKFLQSKPSVKNMNINYYDPYYTVIKNRNDDEIVNNKFEYKEVDYINFNDIMTPNHYIVIKPRETILKYGKMRSYLNHFKKFLLYK